MIRTEVRTNAPTGDKCIRLLMDAEKRGAARVKRAQKFRAFKIRQARIEAEAAVHDFRDVSFFCLFNYFYFIGTVVYVIS